MQDDEARKILLQALFLTGRDKPDLELARDPASFGTLILEVIKLLAPARDVGHAGEHGVEVRFPESESRRVGLFVDTRKLFSRLDPDGAGRNEAALLGIVRELAERVNPDRDLLGHVSGDRLDPERLVFLPRSPEQIAATENPGGMPEVPSDKELSAIVSREGIGHVRMALAVDLGGRYLYVSRHVAARSGKSHDELFGIASRNATRLGDSVDIRAAAASRIIQIADLGGNAASLLADEDFWIALSREAGEGLFIHAAGQDHLYALRMGDQKAILTVMEMAATGQTPSLVPHTFFACDVDGLRLFATG